MSRAEPAGAAPGGAASGVVAGVVAIVDHGICVCAAGWPAPVIPLPLVDDPV